MFGFTVKQLSVTCASSKTHEVQQSLLFKLLLMLWEEIAFCPLPSSGHMSSQTPTIPATDGCTIIVDSNSRSLDDNGKFCWTQPDSYISQVVTAMLLLNCRCWIGTSEVLLQMHTPRRSSTNTHSQHEIQIILLNRISFVCTVLQRLASI